MQNERPDAETETESLPFPPPTPPAKKKPRNEAEEQAYWDGYLAGLESAIHGISAALKRCRLDRELEGSEGDPFKN